MDSENSVNGQNMPMLQPKPQNKYNNRRNPLREIEVIRGPKKEVEEIDASEDEADKTSPKN
jgi:hypothetical protein